MLFTESEFATGYKHTVSMGIFRGKHVEQLISRTSGYKFYDLKNGCITFFHHQSPALPESKRSLYLA